VGETCFTTVTDRPPSDSVWDRNACRELLVSGSLTTWAESCGEVQLDWRLVLVYLAAGMVALFAL
jgi:hypothetical protein